MSISDKLAVLSTVSFEVYPSILGTSYEQIRILGHLSARTARRSGYDVDAMHTAVYPQLPSGVPKSPDQYLFVEFQFPNGKVGCIGMPWIREDTIEVFTYDSVEITVPNITPARREQLIAHLAAGGYDVVNVKYISQQG